MISWYMKIVLFEIVFTMGPHPHNERDLIGPWREPILDMITNLGVKNYTFIFTKEYYGNDRGNGSFDGGLGILQRNEADVMPMPVLMDFAFNEVATLGTLIYEIEGRIYSIITVTPHPSDVLSVFRSFEAEIVVQIFMSCLCFCLLLYEVEQTSRGRSIGRALVQTLGYFWHFFNVLILNPMLKSRLTVAKQLFQFYTICFMFFTWFWTNMICTDMTTYDTSKVMHTMEDLARLKDVIPMILSSDQYGSEFKRHINQGNIHLDEVMNRTQISPVVTEIGANDVEQIQAWMERLLSIRDGRMVLLGSNLVTDSIINAMCGAINTVQKNFQLYSGKEGLFPNSMGIFYAKNISKDHKRDLDARVQRFTESGVYQKIMTTLFMTLFSGSPALEKGPVKGCLISFDDHMKEVGPNTGQAVKVVNMMGAFTLLAFGFLTAALVLIFELNLLLNQMQRPINRALVLSRRALRVRGNRVGPFTTSWSDPVHAYP